MTDEKSEEIIGDEKSRNRHQVARGFWVAGRTEGRVLSGANQMEPEKMTPPATNPDPAVIAERNERLAAAYETHQRRLRNLAALLVRDRADPDDVLSEVFRKAIAKWHTYDPQRDIYQWLAGIVRTTAADAVRAKKRDRLVMSPEVEPATVAESPSGFLGLDPEDTCEIFKNLLSPALQEYWTAYQEAEMDNDKASGRLGITGGAGRHKLAKLKEWGRFLRAAADYERGGCWCRLRRVTAEAKTREQLLRVMTYEEPAYQAILDEVKRDRHSSERTPDDREYSAVRLLLGYAGYLKLIRDTAALGEPYVNHDQLEVKYARGVHLFSALLRAHIQLGWERECGHAQRTKEILAAEPIVDEVVEWVRAAIVDCHPKAHGRAVIYFGKRLFCEHY